MIHTYKVYRVVYGKFVGFEKLVTTNRSVLRVMVGNKCTNST